jgi:uncharacterized membrane protein YfcA
MEIWQLAIYGAVGFAMSILSGIAGAGAGFVTTPLAIFLGLPPAQAVSTGKLNGLAVSIGSLSGMSKVRSSVTWRRIIPVMLLALAVGLVTPFIIKSLDNSFYRIALGIILLLMIPIVILKKVGLKPRRPKTWQKITGGGLLTLSLLLQGIFSGGLGSLVNIVLMGMLGMTAIEANITKRWSQMILNTTIVLGVVGSGLIVWQVGIVGAVSTLAGSYIGGRMAVYKGNAFIMHVMVALMLVSGVALLLSA